MCSFNKNAKLIQENLHIKSPLVENLSCSEYSNGRPVYLKLDNNQPGGSFKIRGIGRSCQLAKEQGYDEIVCPSGGNAGVASAYAARMLNLKAIIVIFKITSEEIANKIEKEGAQVVRYGNRSDESIDHAKYLASDKTKRRKFIHPFDDPAVWEGNSSLIDEIYRDLNGVQPSLIVTCCVGGGLFCGIMKGLERYKWHSTGVLVMETTGSGSFKAMTENDYKPIKIVCDTLAKTLTSVIVCQEAANYASNPKFNVYSEVVTDLEAMEACLLIADHQRIMVELSCGTVLSALYKGIISQILSSHPNLPDGPLVMIVCGGNDVKLKDMNEWKRLVDEAKGFNS